MASFTVRSAAAGALSVYGLRRPAKTPRCLLRCSRAFAGERASVIQIRFFRRGGQRCEPAPPRLHHRRKSLTPPVALCQAPTVVPLEAVPTAKKAALLGGPTRRRFLFRPRTPSNQNRAALNPSSKTTALRQTATPGASVPRITEFPAHCITCRSTRRTPAMPCFTVRSAPAGDTLSAALARLCDASRSAKLRTRRSRVNANSLYRWPDLTRRHSIQPELNSTTYSSLDGSWAPTDGRYRSKTMS